MPAFREYLFLAQIFVMQKKIKHVVAQVKYLQYLILCLLERMYFLLSQTNFGWLNWIYLVNLVFLSCFEKNPAYGRQRISRPMRIVGPIQYWRGCVIKKILHTETKNLSTNADSRTNTILERLRDLSEKKRKKLRLQDFSNLFFFF